MGLGVDPTVGINRPNNIVFVRQELYQILDYTKAKKGEFSKRKKGK